ncbi:ABC transporter substrate-binding protein [Acidisphaera sp. L21]|uniref:ABC transporter substrate-binding protein n=1 Tax=Acidisphaera sp. L21 TaxID=1641851 RepID=UPI001C201619|nr:ABC transporter substrate-binding protein [Acidisphaera sp. L21]
MKYRFAALLLAAGALAHNPAAAAPGCTLRVGMTLASLPTQNGSPDQGTEGIRFMGYTLYDALIDWDLSRADRSSGLTPGLATSWTVDPQDRTKWTFKLRQGVTFQDGSPFNADAVIWNMDKVLNKAAPQYDVSQVAQVVWRLPSIAGYRKIDDQTVEISTTGADATLPYQMTAVLMASPARWQAAGKDWAEFGKHPVGTGPWMLDQYSPREQATLLRNAGYWDKARVPKCDRLVLRPVPDANTRTAALLSGQLDWIESPAPDTLDRIRAGGGKVLTGVMPHLWPFTLNRTPGSPLNDIRVRKALNLAIDRPGLVELLGGLAQPATGVVAEDNPWYGNPSFHIKYDPAEAKRLLTEAGYGPDHPLHLKFMISTSGSGQMYPLPMNEFIQQNFADVGVKLEFEVLEWQALRTRRDAGGAMGPSNKGIDAINNSWNSMDPLSAFLRHVDSKGTPPIGLNWGFLNDPELDKLSEEARQTFDPKAQDAVLAKINARMVDQAVWIFVVHDVNPRAVTAKVHGVVEAQSWFVDFSPVSVDP